jgi:hypothetical protein
MATDERQKLNEMKKRILALLPGERVMEEIRLARDLGAIVTVDHVVDVAVASQRGTQLAQPAHIAAIATVTARGLSGSPGSGLGGLVAKLPGVDRKALSCMIESDLAGLTGGDPDHRLGALADNLDLLDAVDPSGKASAPLRKRLAESVFGRIKFKDQGRQPGGGMAAAELNARKTK